MLFFQSSNPIETNNTIDIIRPTMEISSLDNQKESEVDNENTTSLITPTPSTIAPMELEKSSIAKLLANDTDDKTVTDTDTNDPSINTEKKTRNKNNKTQ